MIDLNVTTCRGCGVEVVLARRSNGKHVSVDAEPHEWGNVLLTVPRDSEGLPLAMVLAPQDRLKDPEPLRRVHDCPYTRVHSHLTEDIC